MAGIGVVFNPNSKSNRRNPYRRRVMEQILGNSGIVRETRTPDEVGSVAKEFLKRKIDILCICGGDGTMHHTLTAFIRTYGKKHLPMVYPLEGGTMNTIRTDLNMKGSAEKNLRVIVRKYNCGEIFFTCERDIIKVGDKYGFMMGGGILVNFLQSYYEGSWTGPLKGLFVLLRLIFSTIFRTPFSKRIFAPLKATMWANGNQLKLRNFSAILIFAIESIGLGFKPGFRSKERVGYFHCLATEISLWGLTRNLYKLYSGLSLAGPRTYEDIVKEIVIKSEGRFQYMIDGDIYDSDGTITLNQGPRIAFIAK